MTTSPAAHVTTLSEFLLARISEDEEHVRVNPGYVVPANPEGQWIKIARPEAECEAKRRIVTLHYDYWAESNEANAEWEDPKDRLPSFCACCNDSEVYYEAGRWPCTTLRALALPYAGHPDFRSEWAI